jgi:V8-like Glu-specific endopeptidase
MSSRSFLLCLFFLLIPLEGRANQDSVQSTCSDPHVDRQSGQQNETATEGINWRCFNTSVAVVGRSELGLVVSFCSGVAIDPQTVVTAGHCIESLARAGGDVQIYRKPVVDFREPPDSISDQYSLHLDRLYNRERSYFHRDRGMIKLSRPIVPLPGETLHFPKLRSHLQAQIEASGVIHRIGFGRRTSASGLAEHRRTWVKAKVHSVLPETLVTKDIYAMPGDSGGPIYLFLPGEGLFLIGLHSTLDRASGFVFSPRIF